VPIQSGSTIIGFVPNVGEVVQRLDGLRQDAALAGRLADVRDHLLAWEGGDEDAGVLAANALEQLHGVLTDLGPLVGAVLRDCEAMLAVLPPAPE
jgi:hypothetical protein